MDFHCLNHAHHSFPYSTKWNYKPDPTPALDAPQSKPSPKERNSAYTKRDHPAYLYPGEPRGSYQRGGTFYTLTVLAFSHIGAQSRPSTIPGHNLRN